MNKSIVVIPDIHGEFWALDMIMAQYPTTDYFYVFLGDIVDRGESSFKTFYKVYDILINGHGIAVKSNHDNKFYRWCKRFVENPSEEFDNYGLVVRNGLRETIDELYGLQGRYSPLQYAIDFVDYYENYTKIYHHIFNPFSMTDHYFAHAGLHSSFRSEKLKDAESQAIYQINENTEKISEFLNNINDVVVHVGHLVQVDEKGNLVHVPTSLRDNKKDVTIVHHDIGLGKHELKEIFDPGTMIDVIGWDSDYRYWPEQKSMKNECWSCKNRLPGAESGGVSCGTPDPEMEGDDFGLRYDKFDYPVSFVPYYKSRNCNNYEKN